MSTSKATRDAAKRLAKVRDLLRDRARAAAAKEEQALLAERAHHDALIARRDAAQPACGDERERAFGELTAYFAARALTESERALTRAERSHHQAELLARKKALEAERAHEVSKHLAQEARTAAEQKSRKYLDALSSERAARKPT